MKNAEIKNSTSARQISLLQEQALKYQHQVNDSLSKAESLDRELNTQKEIMSQLEQTKKEYIDRLKRELDSIESRYGNLLNENAMVGEDNRSIAYHNAIIICDLK